MPDHAATPAFRSKTLTAALAFFFGGLGAHRFYLHGMRDVFGWLHLLATVAGVVGVQRLTGSHLQSGTGWLYAAAGYVSVLAALLAAIVYGLRPDAKWDARFNAVPADADADAKADADADAAGGGGERHSHSGWTVILIVMAALFVGASILMGGLAIGMQTYFEAQLGQSGLH
ncbi:MAG: NINE protein [Janthinobacterium lividum]